MGKEIIKYHNDMNKVSFAGFKEKELDLFFSICQKMKDKGTNEIIFSFSDLRKLSQYSNRSIERFYSDLDRVYKKMLELNLKYEDEKELRRFVLFSRYIIKKEEQTIIIKASEDFEYILNKLIGTFTKFDLVDFVSLKSIYSKNMFKLLKQWDSKKNIKYEVEELREILGVPNKYTTSNFNDRVLKPIMDELPNYFNGLYLEKLKTGRKVTHLKFTWSSKKEEIKEVEKIEIEISEKLNKSIQKAKKNRFIEKLLNNDNIEILVNTFKENNLVRGLIWASKEIRRDISTLDYLIKTIKTGAERSEKKIVVKEAIEEIKEVLEEKMESPIVIDDQKKEIPEKIKVTQTEYEGLYQAYLKENNEKHNPYARKGFDIANKNKYEIIENKKQKIQDELVSSIYKIFMIENKLEENFESKKLFDEYFEKNYVLTNDFKNQEEWNSFLEFQDEVLSKEGYLTTKELNQDLTYDEYKQHLEIETEDDYNSLGEVLLSNESLKENFQEQKTPLNDETLLEEIKIREQFSELFKNREDYTLAWMKNQIELEELKQILNKKKNRIEVKKLEDIETDKLLSKKGTPLKGGALIARLEKIARDENIKIQYKDKIIEK